MDIRFRGHSIFLTIQRSPGFVRRDIGFDFFDWARATADVGVVGTAVVAVCRVDVAHGADVVVYGCGEVVDGGGVFEVGTAVGFGVWA